MAASEPTMKPYRTGWIWAILTFFLVTGTVASAFVVYGLTDLWPSGAHLDAALAVGLGLLVAILSLLFLAGLLYRIDRLRGVPHRRVELFE
jgi:hypothetical protein